MAVVRYSLTGRILGGGGASLKFTPVDRDGRQTVGETVNSGTLVFPPETVEADSSGSFAINLVPSINQDWVYRLDITLSGQAVRGWSGLLLDMPAAASTIDELINIGPKCSVRGAKFTDLVDTPNTYNGRTEQYVKVKEDGTGLTTTAVAPGGGIDGIVVEDEGAAQGSATRFDFRGNAVQAVRAGEKATVTISAPTVAEVDAQVRAGTHTWARNGNVDPLPDEKIPRGIARDTEVTSEIATEVAAEAALRTTADNELSRRITTAQQEATAARTEAGEKLNEAEVDARVRAGTEPWAQDGNGDDIPEEKIPEEIARDDEVTAAVAAETAARTTAIQAEAAARSSAIAAESASHAQALQAETDARTRGIAAERAARQQADTSEITARTQADTALGARIDQKLDENAVDTRVRAGTYPWARDGNTDKVPDEKLPDGIARDSEVTAAVADKLDQSQVDARIRAGTQDWAHEGDTDPLPDEKIPQGIARDSEVADRVAAEALARGDADTALGDRIDAVPVLYSGSAAASGGKDTDHYWRTGATFPGLYKKVAGSWSRIFTPGDGVTARSNFSSGTAMPSGGEDGDFYWRTGATLPGLYTKAAGTWSRIYTPGEGAVATPKATDSQVDAVAATDADLDGIQAAAQSALDDNGFLSVRKGTRLLARVLKGATTTVRGVVVLARNADVDATETDTTRIPTVAGAKRLALRLISSGVENWAKPGNATKVPDGKLPATIARDSEVSTAVGDEASLRSQADVALGGRIDGIPVLRSGAAAATGGKDTDHYWRTGATLPGLYKRVAGVWSRIYTPGQASVTIPKATDAQVDTVAETDIDLDGIQATAQGLLDDDGFLSVRKGTRLLARVLKNASETVRGAVVLARNQDVDATETDTARVPTVASSKRLALRLINIVIDDPTTPVAATAANKDKLLYRPWIPQLFSAHPIHHVGRAITWRDFAALDVPAGFTWGGVHQIAPSPTTLAEDTVVYIVSEETFQRVSAFGQNRFYVVYDFPYYIGTPANKADADAKITPEIGANGVAYWGGKLQHVASYAERAPDTYSWVPYEVGLNTDKVDERIRLWADSGTATNLETALEHQFRENFEFDDLPGTPSAIAVGDLGKFLRVASLDPLTLEYADVPEGLTEDRVNQLIAAGVLDWAENADTDPIPATKLTNAIVEVRKHLPAFLNVDIEPSGISGAVPPDRFTVRLSERVRPGRITSFSARYNGTPLTPVQGALYIANDGWTVLEFTVSAQAKTQIAAASGIGTAKKIAIDITFNYEDGTVVTDEIAFPTNNPAYDGGGGGGATVPADRVLVPARALPDATSNRPSAQRVNSVTLPANYTDWKYLDIMPWVLARPTHVTGALSRIPTAVLAAQTASRNFVLIGDVDIAEEVEVFIQGTWNPTARTFTSASGRWTDIAYAALASDPVGSVSSGGGGLRDDSAVVNVSIDFTDVVTTYRNWRDLLWTIPAHTPANDALYEIYVENGAGTVSGDPDANKTSITTMYVRGSVLRSLPTFTVGTANVNRAGFRVQLDQADQAIFLAQSATHNLILTAHGDKSDVYPMRITRIL